MTSSHHDSFCARWAKPGLLMLHAACLVFACATVVEEPAATNSSVTGSDLTSSTGGACSTETATTSMATTASLGTTSAVTTGLPEPTGSVTTSGEAATSTSTSSSLSVTTSTSVTASSATTATATTGNAATSSTGTSSTGTSSAGTSSATAVTSSGSTSTGSFATTVTGGTGGASASATTTGGSTVFCDAARTPSENVASEGSTGAFGTKDGACYRLEFTPAAFAGWGCSNFEAGMSTRTITVNGESVTCGELPLPAPVDGGSYFDFGPGGNVSAAMYWWNWQ